MEDNRGSSIPVVNLDDGEVPDNQIANADTFRKVLTEIEETIEKKWVADRSTVKMSANNEQFIE